MFRTTDRIGIYTCQVLFQDESLSQVALARPAREDPQAAAAAEPEASPSVPQHTQSTITILGLKAGDRQEGQGRPDGAAGAGGVANLGSPVHPGMSAFRVICPFPWFELSEEHLILPWLGIPYHFLSRWLEIEVMVEIVIGGINK